MPTVNIRDAKGGEAGTLELADGVFGIEPNKDAVRQTLLAYQANQRQGTHSTKTRAFVRGGGRKPWKQKGTGRARQGSIRAPQWRGGAIIFGPQPRSYRQKLNKKMRRLALSSALSDLRQNNQMTVVGEFGLSNPKTKEFVAVMDRLGISQAQRILILIDSGDSIVQRSARNLPTVIVSEANNINIYNLLTCDHLIATPAALRALEKQFGQEEEAA